MSERTEKDVQCEVTEALISANMNPSVPFDVVKMARQFGFAVHNFRTIPKNVIGFMFLNMDKKMSRMVKSDKLIGLNFYHDEPHKRFAIAHELGHFFMHYEICKNKENPVFFHIRDNEEGIEGEACKFAAMLLMEKDLFSENYYAFSENNFEEITIIRFLSEKFQTPQVSVRRRIQELRLNA